MVKVICDCKREMKQKETTSGTLFRKTYKREYFECEHCGNKVTVLS